MIAFLFFLSLFQGSFGKVRLVMDLRSNGLRAVKMVNKKTLQMRQMYARVGAGESNKDPEVVMRREIDVMKQLHHDNVVRVHEVIDDPQGTDLLMVLEYVEGGPLIKQRPDGSSDPIAERSARIYFRQVLMGLSYLHSHNVIHGDVKPDNLLLSASGTVKITDFGSAVVLQPGEEDILCRTTGTPAFLAPEVCSGHNFHGKAQDLWALGVSLYAMVYGRLPFRGNTIWDLYERRVLPRPFFGFLLHKYVRDGTENEPFFLQPRILLYESFLLAHSKKKGGMCRKLDAYVSSRRFDSDFGLYNKVVCLYLNALYIPFVVLMSTFIHIGSSTTPRPWTIRASSARPS